MTVRSSSDEKKKSDKILRHSSRSPRGRARCAALFPPEAAEQESNEASVQLTVKKEKSRGGPWRETV